jgi:hypothetical protein
MVSNSVFSNVGALLVIMPSRAKNGMSHFKVVEFDHFESGANVPSGQKETPGPLNCKQSRKGSWGQLRQAALANGFSQTFCKQISLTHIGGGRP